MGNRENLEAAAANLVRSKRFGAITARDLARAAGSSTAAINYHFRSLDALLMRALLDTMTELGDQISIRVGRAGQSDGRTHAFWAAVATSVHDHRALWLANFEALLEAETRPDLREQLRQALAFGSRELSETLLPDSTLDPDSSGRVLDAIMLGLVVLELLDPDTAPSPEQINETLHAIVTPHS
jgi:AcrR family transcriptional regulator